MDFEFVDSYSKISNLSSILFELNEIRQFIDMRISHINNFIQDELSRIEKRKL